LPVVFSQVATQALRCDTLKKQWKGRQSLLHRATARLICRSCARRFQFIECKVWRSTCAARSLASYAHAQSLVATDELGLIDPKHSESRTLVSSDNLGINVYMSRIYEARTYVFAAEGIGGGQRLTLLDVARLGPGLGHKAAPLM